MHSLTTAESIYIVFYIVFHVFTGELCVVGFSHGSLYLIICLLGLQTAVSVPTFWHSWMCYILAKSCLVVSNDKKSYENGRLFTCLRWGLLHCCWISDTRGKIWRHLIGQSTSHHWSSVLLCGDDAFGILCVNVMSPLWYACPVVQAWCKVFWLYSISPASIWPRSFYAVLLSKPLIFSEFMWQLVVATQRVRVLSSSDC